MNEPRDGGAKKWFETGFDFRVSLTKDFQMFDVLCYLFLPVHYLYAFHWSPPASFLCACVRVFADVCVACMEATLFAELSSDFAVLTYDRLVVWHRGPLALHGNSTIAVRNWVLLSVVYCGGKTLTAVSVLLRLCLGEIFRHLVSLALARQCRKCKAPEMATQILAYGNQMYKCNETMRYSSV